MRCNYLTLGSMVKRKICYGIVQPGQSVTDGIPVIKVNNLISGLKSLSELDTTTRENEAKYIRTRLHGGELIISVVGTIGKTAIVPKSFAGCNLVRATALIDIEDALLSKWVKYYIDSPYGQSYIEQNLNTTVQPTLNIKSLEKMSIPLYDTEYMKKIVLLLSSLDEKIAINRAINDNLEQQMQVLFSEYLSSNEFDDLTTVGNVVLSANTGADAIKKAPMVDYNTGIRCVRVGDMTNNRSFHDWGFTKVADNVFKRYQLHKDDIVITRTASLGLNTIIPEDLPAVYNNGLIRLTVNTSNVLPLYLFRQFQTEDFSNYIACIEGETSVRPNMKINYLLKYEFVLPPITKQNEIIALLTPMLNQQNKLIVENKQLEVLRDTLLPKLMSGELDVSDIDL